MLLVKLDPSFISFPGPGRWLASWDESKWNWRQILSLLFPLWENLEYVKLTTASGSKIKLGIFFLVEAARTKCVITGRLSNQYLPDQFRRNIVWNGTIVLMHCEALLFFFSFCFFLLFALFNLLFSDPDDLSIPPDSYRGDIEWLQSNKDPWEKCKTLWSNTSKDRVRQFQNDGQSILHYMESYPGLKDRRGYCLVSCAFRCFLVCKLRTHFKFLILLFSWKLILN